MVADWLTAASNLHISQHHVNQLHCPSATYIQFSSVHFSASTGSSHVGFLEEMS